MRVCVREASPQRALGSVAQEERHPPLPPGFTLFSSLDRPSVGPSLLLLSAKTAICCSNLDLLHLFAHPIPAFQPPTGGASGAFSQSFHDVPQESAS